MLRKLSNIVQVAVGSILVACGLLAGVAGALVAIVGASLFYWGMRLVVPSGTSVRKAVMDIVDPAADEGLRQGQTRSDFFVGPHIH